MQQPASAQTVVVTANHYNDPLRDDTVAQNTASDDAVICHKNFTTGSRLSISTVCLTKRRWDELQHEQATYLNQQISLRH